MTLPALIPRWPSCPAGWKWGLLWSLMRSFRKTRVNTCGVKWPIRERFCGGRVVTNELRGGTLLSGKSAQLHSFRTALSHLMRRPLIRLETKDCVMEWGVAWERKALLVLKEAKAEPTWAGEQWPEFGLKGDKQTRFYAQDFYAYNSRVAQKLMLYLGVHVAVKRIIHVRYAEDTEGVCVTWGRCCPPQTLDRKWSVCL